jgi:hypothetical protein
MTMKYIITIAILFVSVSIGKSQCNTFFPMRENVKVFYDHYDKKEKVALRSTQKLINVSGAGNEMKGTMVQELIDPKKEERIATSDSDWSCNGGTIHFNMNSMTLDPAQAGMGANGMTMDVSGDKMDIPSSFQVGEKLKDLNYQIQMNMNGVPLMTRIFAVTDRKVESEEDVTTPAGTFSCFKVSFTTSSKGGIGGGTTKSVMWYAKDIGLVKAETFADNGKLIGKQVLTKIEK